MMKAVLAKDGERRALLEWKACANGACGSCKIFKASCQRYSAMMAIEIFIVLEDGHD